MYFTTTKKCKERLIENYHWNHVQVSCGSPLGATHKSCPPTSSRSQRLPTLGRPPSEWVSCSTYCTYFSWPPWDRAIGIRSCSTCGQHFNWQPGKSYYQSEFMQYILYISSQPRDRAIGISSYSTCAQHLSWHPGNSYHQSEFMQYVLYISSQPRAIGISSCSTSIGNLGTATIRVGSCST
jgi:hypothetical protein